MKAISARHSASLSASFAVAAFLSVSATVLDAEAQVKLFFASDVHAQTSNLTAKIDELCGSDNAQCNVVGIIGDYGAGNCETTPYNDVLNIANARASDYAVLSQGNHELTSRLGACSGEALRTYPAGLAAQGSNYEIFVINVPDLLASDAGFSVLANNLMTECLASGNSARQQKVFIVMSHIPLHSSRRITSDSKVLSAAKQKTRLTQLFTSLYQCSQQRNIVFLAGHNHSSLSYDTNVNYLVTWLNETPIGGAGNSYVYPEFVNAYPSFAYLNAGYIKPRDTNVSATLITIYSDSYVVTRVGDQPGVATEPRYAHWDPNVP